MLHHHELLDARHTLAALSGMHDDWSIPRRADMDWSTARELLVFAGLGEADAERILVDIQSSPVQLPVDGDPLDTPWGPWAQKNRLAAGLVRTLVAEKILSREQADAALVAGIVVTVG